MYFIGIDPGLSGAICILKNDKIEYITKTPMIEFIDGTTKIWYDINEIINIFKKYKNANVVLELQRPMSKQGVTSMFKIGRGFGIFEGLIYNNFENFNIIDPKKWQNYLSKQFLTKEETDCFISKNLKYDSLINNIKDEEFKLWYTKFTSNKSTSLSKVKSAYIYYKIKESYNINIMYKDNNLVDAFLISFYCLKNVR